MPPKKKFTRKPKPGPTALGRTVLIVEIDASGTRVYGEQQIHDADGLVTERIAFDGELESSEEAALIVAAESVRGRVKSDLVLA